MKVFIDGKYHDEQDAKVSVFDHGLLYGDGVFEGIRAYNGRVFKLKEHIDRLFYSAKAILLDIPMSHAELMAATTATCRDTGSGRPGSSGPPGACRLPRALRGWGNRGVRRSRPTPGR